MIHRIAALLAPMFAIACGQAPSSMDAQTALDAVISDATGGDVSDVEPMPLTFAQECQTELNLSPSDCIRLTAMHLPATPPRAAGNEYADSDSAANLGFQLFFDPALGTGVACASCHAPELAFTDRLSVSIGKSRGVRNAPTIFNAAELSVIFWDGRADSLWSQPLFAIENPVEMASTRLSLAHHVADRADLRQLYETTFGPMPDLSALPLDGRPGDPSFDTLPANDQDNINRIAANVGKSYQAYMRRNVSGPAAFDNYIDGDTNALTDVAKRGMALLVTQHCIDCHSGPMFSDQGFHAVGFPSLAGAAPDSARLGGLAILRASIFNLDGPYADHSVPRDPDFVAPPEPTNANGAFRTPSLRGVTETGPYGHDGALARLADVLAIHAPSLTTDQKAEIIAFFGNLVGQRPPLPWRDWPQPQ